MRITRHEETRLTAGLEAEITDLLARCFPTDFGGRSFFQNRHHARLVAREGEVLVGHLAVCFRAVRLGEELLDAAGFAEVAVDPAFRGRGVGAALIAAGLEEARAARAAVALLFGERSLYAAAGFAAAGNPVTRTDTPGARTGETLRGPHPCLRVHPLNGRAWNDAATLDLAGFVF